MSKTSKLEAAYLAVLLLALCATALGSLLGGYEQWRANNVALEMVHTGAMIQHDDAQGIPPMYPAPSSEAAPSAEPTPGDDDERSPGPNPDQVYFDQVRPL